MKKCCENAVFHCFRFRGLQQRCFGLSCFFHYFLSVVSIRRCQEYSLLSFFGRNPLYLHHFGGGSIIQGFSDQFLYIISMFALPISKLQILQMSTCIIFVCRNQSVLIFFCHRWFRFDWLNCLYLYLVFVLDFNIYFSSIRFYRSVVSDYNTHTYIRYWNLWDNAFCYSLVEWCSILPTWVFHWFNSHDWKRIEEIL